MKTLSPTNYHRPPRSTAPAVAAAQSSRASQIPEIFVAIESIRYTPPHCAKARLQNKRGYVYLTWRQGKQVKTVYVGKAKKN